MSTLSRTEVLRVMRRTGHFAQIPEAQAVLPEQVDLERDWRLLEGLGLRGPLDGGPGSQSANRPETPTSVGLDPIRFTETQRTSDDALSSLRLHELSQVVRAELEREERAVDADFTRQQAYDVRLRSLYLAIGVAENHTTRALRPPARDEIAAGDPEGAPVSPASARRTGHRPQPPTPVRVPAPHAEPTGPVWTGPQRHHRPVPEPNPAFPVALCRRAKDEPAPI